MGTQNNLGNALHAIGVRESGTVKLEEAVARFREALKERTRERVPLQWAMTQNNLGNTLQVLGGRESGTAKLNEAVVAFREALKERTRERVPLDWATTQELGNALSRLGERDSGTVKLEEAFAAYRGAEGANPRARATPVGHEFWQSRCRAGAPRPAARRRRHGGDRPQPDQYCL
jgi:exonuclease VII small subunit